MNLRLIRAWLFVVVIAGVAAATALSHHESRAFDTPEHDASFSWAVSHYLDNRGSSIGYRFEIHPTAEGGFYHSEYQLGERRWTHRGKMTAAQYDAFISGLEECGVWDVESNGHYDAYTPTYIMSTCEQERSHSAVFTGLSTAYQNSLHAYLMRALPGQDMHDLETVAQRHDDLVQDESALHSI